MAVTITVRGTYFVPSTISGKKDLKDFTVDIPYPVEVDYDDSSEVSEAMFFIKRFLLTDYVKATDKKNFYGVHTSECHFIEALEGDELSKAIGSGDILAIDPDTLTAQDINEIKKSSDFIKVLILCDTDRHMTSAGKSVFNDITDFVARNRTLWQGKDVKSKRAKLKWLLGIEEAAEVKATNKSKKRSKLLAAAGIKEEKKTPRPARKKVESTIEVAV